MIWKTYFMATPINPDSPAARGTPTGSVYVFLRRFSQLALAYWSSEQRWQIRNMSFLLLLLTIAQVALAVWTSYWNRALFDALEDRSIKNFLLEIGTFLVIFVLTIGVTAFHLHVKRWLQLGWRQWLTEKLIDRWMSRGHHYQLQFTPGEHDNPDGRIADDIRITTETAIALAHTFTYSLLSLGLFFDILLSVSGSIDVPGTSYYVPGYMVWMAILYAGAGALLGFIFAEPITRTTNTLQTAEADFRFGLSRERENSEAIALMHGESVERRRSSKLFTQIAYWWNRQTLAYAGIVSFSAGYGALLPVFPILIAAPQYIAGTMTLGLLMQSAQAFQKLTSALSWPIDNMGDLAKCRASAERVLTLYDDLLLLEQPPQQADESRINIGVSASAKLEVRNLCIANADGQIIIEHLDFTIERGERVLIAGDPAVTISLFKAVAGLWPWGKGEVLLPHDHNIVFMPQRPFLPAGTLQSVLSYPAPADVFDVRALHYALECAGLGWLAPRLNDIDSWDHVLPMRAQQRLAFARVFLHRPFWIFMEEATDAFNAEGEAGIMDMLRRELPNATVITISFHPGMEHLHDRKLVLERLPEKKFLFKRTPLQQAATVDSSQPGNTPSTPV
jgi:vitamin B12/bleomycin/antimicrobial peptide transport system ATP-binding/permease protein